MQPSKDGCCYIRTCLIVVRARNFRHLQPDSHDHTTSLSVETKMVSNAPNSATPNSANSATAATLTEKCAVRKVCCHTRHSADLFGTTCDTITVQYH